MSRCIDADALLDEVMERHCKECDKRKGIKNGKYRIIYEIGDAPCRACDVDDFTDELENAPTIEPEPHWIPCSERLPFAEYGESDNVLATCGYRDCEDTSIRWIRTLYFNGGVWCYPTGETYEQKVYAWMPLPEPYREEGD